jgi:hypothetical protein
LATQSAILWARADSQRLGAELATLRSEEVNPCAGTRRAGMLRALSQTFPLAVIGRTFLSGPRANVLTLGSG